ncbi:uncharacterized protein TRIADDRAFT_53750 [Trichoplax adhaerens]|uniref:TMC domain-containing protein n=1 Tax=Trichoplax adhaerens TaxID=10228 RepID=B3RQ24_TRIAD|nr:hypothetical protein TRIADDRAFT_53750 [Trichoplax adhaerens]EDV27745.1 hypothetical protein TRIADDRAFT_53750 [Trichoplax adhaerens]|eukprot:XP_002109579.1 hypothetical protein TRIADDRAFT_53750 [Trichoplax adhaerens]
MTSRVYPRQTSIEMKPRNGPPEYNREISRSELPGSPMHDETKPNKPILRHTDTRTGLQRRKSSLLTQMLPSRQAVQSVPGANLTRKTIETERRRSLAARSLSRFRLQSVPDEAEEEEEDQSNYHENRVKSGLVRQYASSIKKKREEYQRLQSEMASKRPHHIHKKYGAVKDLKWKLFKQRLKENFTFTLWKSHLKEIEGQFGNGVLSYFIFLKWLFFLDLLLGLLWFGFICIPEFLLNDNVIVSADYVTFNVSQSIAATASGAGIYCSSDYITNTTANTNLFIVIISGKGQMECSQLFYGNYTADVVHTSGVASYFNVPFAYFIITLIHFVLSLILVARNASETYRKSYIEGGDTIHQYCNKIFGGWDYCVCEEKAAELKKKSIAHDIKVDLAEEIRAIKAKQRSNGEKLVIYSKRLVLNIVILGLLCAAGVAIYYAANETIQSQTTNASSGFLQLLRNYAASLTLSALNIILPWFFTLLIQYENYSPNFEIQLTLVRTVFLKLASVVVLLASLFAVTRTAASSGGSDTLLCWETYVGQELFKLVIMNFLVVVFATILVEFPQKLVADKVNFENCCLQIKRPEFQIPKNVLDLVYAQVLCWLGAFYCPMVPLMVVASLIIIFYVKKISLVYNNQPSQRPYRASKSNSFFMLLLIISFFLAAFPVGYGWTSLTPSKQCGPYSLGIYYFRSLARARSLKIQLLKEQLVMEGKDKSFLLEQISKAEGLDEIEEEGEDNYKNVKMEEDRV